MARESLLRLAHCGTGKGHQRNNIDSFGIKSSSEERCSIYTSTRVRHLCSYLKVEWEESEREKSQLIDPLGQPDRLVWRVLALQWKCCFSFGTLPWTSQSTSILGAQEMISGEAHPSCSHLKGRPRRRRKTLWSGSSPALFSVILGAVGQSN